MPDNAEVNLAIITPTYNRPELFERLHRSLLAGGEVEWHHYVVDDGSAADYADAVRRCERLSGRLTFDRIANGGPLIARNRAIDLALANGCTHLCFFDDDDEMIPSGTSLITDRIRQYSGVDWFIFRSAGDALREISWPAEPTIVSWFDDVVCNRQFGSDNAVVVSSRLVGATRFSGRGRNQREWTFFLGLSEKRDDVLVCPEFVRKIEYLPGGLTSEAARARPSLEQISNSIERAVRYWLRKPLSLPLFLNAVRQILAGPFRYMLADRH